MPGIPQWSKNVQVQANQFRRVRNLDLTGSVAIAAGQLLQLYVYAPVGYYGFVTGIDIDWPVQAGATSGTKSVGIISAGPTGVLRADFAYNLRSYFRYGEWDPAVAATLKIPASDAQAMLNLQKSSYDESNPLVISFQNLTNVADIQTRSLKLWVSEEKVR